MKWPWRVAISSLTFPAVFVLMYKISDYLFVYQFDWWDPKFGDRAGALRFGNELMPTFLCIASVSYVVALWAERCWFQRQKVFIIAVIGALAAFIQEAISFLLALATRGIDNALAQAIHLLHLTLIFAGPALIGIVLARLMAGIQCKAK
jgi:hypothetical protein